MGNAKIGRWEDLFHTATGGRCSEALFEYVKREADFVDFLETEVGCDLMWMSAEESACCICPMPHHKDTNASFRINISEEDGIWLYYCFGCLSSGTIIDFFKDYYDMQKVTDALEFICHKFDLHEANAVLTDYKKKVNFRKKIECLHIVVSNQCRRMLERDFNKHGAYISSVYKKLNEVLDDNTEETLNMLGDIEFEIMKKAGE